MPLCLDVLKWKEITSVHPSPRTQGKDLCGEGPILVQLTKLFAHTSEMGPKDQNSLISAGQDKKLHTPCTQTQAVVGEHLFPLAGGAGRKKKLEDRDGKSLSLSRSEGICRLPSICLHPGLSVACHGAPGTHRFFMKPKEIDQME